MSGSPKNEFGAPLAAVEPGWSVAKIKRMGADAVKLLAPFEPTEPRSAEHQFQVVEQVHRQCQDHDILLLLETVSFPFGGEKKSDASYLDRKGRTVIEAARQLSRFCDIYKSEFPGTLGRESDEQLEDNLHALDAASERPWVLLSAGVDYADYLKQVDMAMGVGASGVLGGRAFWKEYFLQEGPAARSRFAATTARERLKEVDALVRTRGTPWFARYGFSREELTSIRAAEGWHIRYGSPALAPPGQARPAAVPGEVY
jgi:tagatose 1,6-diphosphate aldolase